MFSGNARNLLTVIALGATFTSQPEAPNVFLYSPPNQDGTPLCAEGTPLPYGELVGKAPLGPEKLIAYHDPFKLFEIFSDHRIQIGIPGTKFGGELKVDLEQLRAFATAQIPSGIPEGQWVDATVETSGVSIAWARWNGNGWDLEVEAPTQRQEGQMCHESGEVYYHSSSSEVR